MNNSDVLKLANDCRSEANNPMLWNGWKYAKVNALLVNRYNRGRDQFKARLRQIIECPAVAVCPWGHVGKNH